MTNPYQSKGSDHFWRTAIAETDCADVAPLPSKRLVIDSRSVIATFGSCFAQNIARALQANKWGTFLQTEQPEADQPLFSALYGNIYTVRQLRQLFDEAVAGRASLAETWRRPDGRFVDPKRPTMFAAGFPSPEAVSEERKRHLVAVQRAFMECNVLIFTMGLTEHWRTSSDHSVVPLAPGVIDPEHNQEGYTFGNFTYDETLSDIQAFITDFHALTPAAQIILTVSPVPLTATFSDEHVLVATAHSKAILRAVCSAAAAANSHVYYFPSYEIITGQHARGRYFSDNLRSVTSEGVDHVMRVFAKSYCQHTGPAEIDPEKVVCDEEEIARSVGF